MSVETVTYLDSSAIVKLVVREPETVALRRYLRRRTTLVSSALARAEVLRAVMQHGQPASKLAGVVLGRLELLRVNDRVLRDAGALTPPGLRTLDAIHLASARMLGDGPKRVLCYDARLAEAFEGHGLKVVAPV